MFFRGVNVNVYKYLVLKACIYNKSYILEKKIQNHAKLLSNPLHKQ